MKRENPIPQSKIKSLKELAELIKTKKTILIASIKDIPASQFQEIGKKLRGKAIVKVPKKSLIFRALDSSEEESVKAIKEKIGNSVAVLFSDLDCFDLAWELVKNKSPAKAKAGQLAPEDIGVEAGPTELIPGPAVSELGSLGIQIQIEKGKIHIKKSKIIVKEGEEISANAADVMNKLDIKPFSIGFIPVCAFDNQEKKLYVDINIDREGTVKELKSSYSRALPFAVEIGYITDGTIRFLIGKAGMHEKALGKLVKKDVVEKVKSEEVKEEKVEDVQTDKSKEDVKND